MSFAPRKANPSDDISLVYIYQEDYLYQEGCEYCIVSIAMCTAPVTGTLLWSIDEELCE